MEGDIETEPRHLLETFSIGGEMERQVKTSMDESMENENTFPIYVVTGVCWEAGRQIHEV